VLVVVSEIEEERGDMQREMDADIAARVDQMVSDADLDALVASSFKNVLYLSGTAIRTQRDIPDRLALAVWRVKQPPTMIVCTIEEAQARAESWIAEIIGYTEFADSPVKVLADVLAETVPRKGVVGIEKRHLTAHYYEELLSLCPELTFVSADDLFERVRMIKAPSEIAILEKAALATDRAIRKAFERIRAGDTEREIALGMEMELRRAGADAIEFDILATGSNAKLAHPNPGDTAAASGQLVRTDFGGRFGGYLSDVARTAVMRPATDRQQETYERLFEVHERIIESIRPGVAACELFRICKSEFERTGLEFAMPHIGHGLGLDIHEHPIVAPFTTEELRPGMVLCIEPIHFADEGRCHIEDLVEVTETGARILSRSADWDTLLEVG
jgi:Xaa-Pro aminopeptidase